MHARGNSASEAAAASNLRESRRTLAGLDAEGQLGQLQVGDRHLICSPEGTVQGVESAGFPSGSRDLMGRGQFGIGGAHSGVMSQPPSPNFGAKPGQPLLARVQDALAVRHYSPRTSEAYQIWIRRFIRFHNRRHPAELGAPEVESFLSSLATERNVSSSTQNQALAAILFLYSEVLHQSLETLAGFVRAKKPQLLPVVMTREEVEAVLAALRGTPLLMTSLLYGSGLRLLECCTLRVKDVDFSSCQLTVRQGKGMKDRVTVLPVAIQSALQAQIDRVRTQHERDLITGAGHVELPGALGVKYPNASRELGWQWLFPATRLYCHSDTGQRRRHHLHETVLQRAVHQAVRNVGLTKAISCHSDVR